MHLSLLEEISFAQAVEEIFSDLLLIIMDFISIISSFWLLVLLFPSFPELSFLFFKFSPIFQDIFWSYLLTTLWPLEDFFLDENEFHRWECFLQYFYWEIYHSNQLDLSLFDWDPVVSHWMSFVFLNNGYIVDYRS